MIIIYNIMIIYCRIHYVFRPMVDLFIFYIDDKCQNNNNQNINRGNVK